jgi:hypothetical protein
MLPTDLLEDLFVCVLMAFPLTQAGQLGLKGGDVLLRYDGVLIRREGDFNQIRAKEPEGGPPKPLLVERAGKTFTVWIHPGLFGAWREDRLRPASIPPKR